MASINPNFQPATTMKPMQHNTMQLMQTKDSSAKAMLLADARKQKTLNRIGGSVVRIASETE